MIFKTKIMNKITRIMIVAALLTGFVACKKDEVKPTGPIEGFAMVLDEGSWGSNNASISLIKDQSGEIENNWFAEMNGRGLGDVAQDIVVYGTKAYVTVTFSNTLEVIDLKSGKSNMLSMGNRQPRYIAAANGSLFISCYTNREVVRVDTTDLIAGNFIVKGTGALGNFQPEGVAVANGKVFVASSWISGQNQSYLYDDKMYVFDAGTMEQIETLTVGINPQQVIAVDENHVAVNYNGNYGDKPAGCAIINTGSLSVSQTLQAVTGMTAYNGMIYGYHSEYGSPATFFRINATDLSKTSLNINVNNPYGISVDPSNGDIYVTTDGNYVANGDVHCFTNNGSQQWSSEAEMLPKKVVFF